MIGSAPSAAPARVEQRRARARAASARSSAWRAPLRDRPVGDEAAEVVDPREVEERERARQPRDPPAVAAALQRRPVVERVAPQLALVGVGVGRRAGHRVVAEQLRVASGGRPSPARRRSARRRSAARRARSRSARSALHSRSKRTWSATAPRPAKRAQSSIQPASRSRKSSSSALRDRRRAARPAGRARPRTPSAPCTASRSGRAGRAAASATTTGRRPRASRPRRTRRAPRRPAGSEVGWSCTPAERGRSHGGARLRRPTFAARASGYSRARCRRRSAQRRRRPDPHPVPAAGRRRRPLPGQAHRRRPRRGHRATCSATATRSCARSSLHRPAGERRRGREAELHALDAHINGVRWGGSFVVDAHGPLGVDDRGLDRRLRHLARRAAAQARGRAARARRAS